MLCMAVVARWCWCWWWRRWCWCISVVKRVDLCFRLQRRDRRGWATAVGSVGVCAIDAHTRARARVRNCRVEGCALFFSRFLGFVSSFLFLFKKKKGTILVNNRTGKQKKLSNAMGASDPLCTLISARTTWGTKQVATRLQIFFRRHHIYFQIL